MSDWQLALHDGGFFISSLPLRLWLPSHCSFSSGLDKRGFWKYQPLFIKCGCFISTGMCSNTYMQYKSYTVYCVYSIPFSFLEGWMSCEVNLFMYSGDKLKMRWYWNGKLCLDSKLKEKLYFPPPDLLEAEHIKFAFRWCITIIATFNGKAGSIENTLAQAVRKYSNSSL